MQDLSFQNEDNFVRNLVSLRCSGLQSFSPIAWKRTMSDELPVDIDTMMLDLRVDSDDEQETVVRMQRAACAFIERRTGYVLLAGSYRVDMPFWWHGPLEIMRGPLRALTGVSYLDENGVTVTISGSALSEFFVEDEQRSFAVRPLRSFDRPTLWSEVRRVRLEFTAGYRAPSESDADLVDLDDGLREVIIMTTGHFYKNRELYAADGLATIEQSAAGLLGTYRQYW